MQGKINIKFYQDPVFWVLVAAGPSVVVVIPLVVSNFSAAPLDKLIQVILIVLVYPCLEEIVFRGAIMESLSRSKSFNLKWGWLSCANLISAALFSLLHLWGQTWEWALAMFMPGLAFGFAKERWGSLMFPVFLHVFYNTCFFGLITA